MAQAKERSITHRRGSRTEPRLASGEFDDLRFDSLREGGLGWLLAGIALVDIGEIDTVTGGGLRGLRQATDLGEVVRVGRRDMQRPEVAQDVDDEVDLRNLLALGPIVPGLLAAFGRRAQGPAVQDGRTRLGRRPGGQPQQRTKFVGQLLEAPGRQPALRRLVDGFPGWKVVGHSAPRRARPHHVAQPVEHLAQAVRALPRILAQQRQARRNQRPFLIRNV